MTRIYIKKKKTAKYELHINAVLKTTQYVIVPAVKDPEVMVMLLPLVFP